MSLADRLAQAKRVAADPQAVSGAGPVQRRARVSTDPFAGLKRSVNQALVESLGPKLYDPHMTAAELESRVRQSLQVVMEREETPLTTVDRTRIAQEVADDILGYGPLEPYLRDSSVSEIMVNGPNRIFVESDGRIMAVPGAFNDDAHLRRTIEKIVARVGRRVDEASP